MKTLFKISIILLSFTLMSSTNSTDRWGIGGNIFLTKKEWNDYQEKIKDKEPYQYYMYQPKREIWTYIYLDRKPTEEEAIKYLMDEWNSENRQKAYYAALSAMGKRN